MALMPRQRKIEAYLARHTERIGYMNGWAIHKLKDGGGMYVYDSATFRLRKVIRQHKPVKREWDPVRDSKPFNGSYTSEELRLEYQHILAAGRNLASKRAWESCVKEIGKARAAVQKSAQAGQEAEQAVDPECPYL